jgi:predicted aspartyl protease
MTRLSIAGWLTCLVLLSACADDGPASCRVNRVADLPLLPNARPMVTAMLDGKPVAVLIDTGGAISAVSQSAADSYDLVGTDRYMTIGGVGNLERAPIVRVSNLGLGNGHARNLELPVLQNLPSKVDGIPFLGIFGADFLSNYDVDIDMPNHRFAMYTLQNCGPIAPLDPPFFDLPFKLDDTKIDVDIHLNGALLHAIFDTGASITLVTQDDALRAGVHQADLLKDPFHRHKGDAHNEIDLWTHRFGQLDVGSESMSNFHFSVGNPEIEQTFLGADFMRFNRIWISYPHRTLFIQPNLKNPIVHLLAATPDDKSAK